MPASRTSPPKRRPLHERSDSQTNELSTPSVRLVNNSFRYGNTSFPSRSSQILIPSDDPSTVSGSHPFLSQPSLNQQSLPSHSIHPTKYEDIGLSRPERARTVETVQISNLDRTVYDTSSSHHQTSNTAFRPSSVLLPERPLAVLHPSNPKRLSSTARLPPLSLPSQENVDTRAENSALNQRRLSSAGNAQSPADHPNQPSAFLHGSTNNQNTIPSYPSTESLSNQLRAGRANSGRRSVSYSAFPPVTPPNNPPPRTLSSNVSYPLRPAKSRPVRTPSGSKQQSRPPTARQIESRSTTDSSAILQYPVIYPPSTQGSWATSSGETLDRSRMNEARLPHRWNTGSSSGGYSVGRIDEGDGDDGRSTQMPPTMAQSPRVLPQGLVGVALASHEAQAWPSNIGSMQGGNIPSTIRVVNGPQVQSNRSRAPRRRSINNRESYPSDRTRETRRKRDENKLAEPGKRDSIVSTGLPAWAKAYYARGDRDAVFDALESAERAKSPKKVSLDKNLPSIPIKPSIPGKHYRRSSPATYLTTNYEDPSTQRSTLHKPVEIICSPHLHHDRNSKRLSLWQAPRVEDRAADGLFSRRRVQIIFFCLGFIFPFAWMIASFLPLPFNPHEGNDNRRYSRAGQSRIEDAFEKTFNPIDEARYDSARWWRNLNRILSALGLLIIGAIIALVIIAIRTRRTGYG